MKQGVKPPPELVARVTGDGGKTGSFRRAFEGLAGLRPDEDVLDVGCGVGRVALDLAGWLEGRYEGFDVDPELIAWCRENISLRNFGFTHVDLYNGTYNPRGQPASEFTFPYPDDSFDFAFGVSIFTHLLPDAFERYVAELRRVLRDGGRTFFTFFLLSPRSRERLKAGGELADALLARNQGDYSAPLETPEDMVAYRQGYVREVYERNGFEFTAMRWGDWPQWAIGQQEGCTQDMIVATVN